MNSSPPDCPRCKTPAKPGARFCSKCGQPLQAPPTAQPYRPQPIQPQPAWQDSPQDYAQAQVGLQIVMPVTWHLTDTALDIFVDGQHVGRGSVNKGVNLHLFTTPGNHILEIGADVMAVGGTIVSAFSMRQFRKSWKLPFGVSGPGERLAKIKYSRAWGNFKVEVV